VKLEQRKQPSPLTDLLAIFEACELSLLENPVFWLRLVAYGYLCHRFVEQRGQALAFQKRSFDVVAMLREADDPEISSEPEKYAAAIRALIPVQLLS
jgi:hypothetical protein